MVFNYLLTIAITYYIVNAVLLEKIKPKRPKWLAELLHCAMCTGFWVGCGVFGLFGAVKPLYIPLYAVVGGLFAFITDIIIDLILQTDNYLLSLEQDEADREKDNRDNKSSM